MRRLLIRVLEVGFPEAVAERALRDRVRALEAILSAREDRMEQENRRLRHQVAGLLTANDWQADLLHEVQKRYPAVMAQLIETESAWSEVEEPDGRP